MKSWVCAGILKFSYSFFLYRARMRKRKRGRECEKMYIFEFLSKKTHSIIHYYYYCCLYSAVINVITRNPRPRMMLPGLPRQLTQSCPRKKKKTETTFCLWKLFASLWITNNLMSCPLAPPSVPPLLPGWRQHQSDELEESRLRFVSVWLVYAKLKVKWLNDSWILRRGTCPASQTQDHQRLWSSSSSLSKRPLPCPLLLAE